ncbi:carboxylating nicotinate-nucleotide diphosphorylase [Streptomyces sp. NPDC052101]|uniref:carboxylating nicotinate-nucleotide diphosphorylase n=1 Tax=Streptomyces sp. NPDC052101 TaxID=3155763 RepID=UPI00343AB623
MMFPDHAARGAIALALAEDAAADDITTRWSVREDLCAQARIISRQAGVAAGIPLAAEVYRQLDPTVVVHDTISDGTPVRPDDVLLRLRGPARSLLAGERTVLNFLQRLCGIATLTSRYVSEVRDLPVRILDTRKTVPGLRALDKYAVTAGGGHNHRMNLAAMVLLKENHIAAAGGVTAAVTAVRKGMADEGRDVLIDVEVTTLAELREAVAAGASWIMLDNMPLHELVESVRLRRHRGLDIVLEASGTITLERLRTIAETGVDVISVGALTHSAPALDLTMLVDGAPRV